jgi:hypothetical protein
LTYRGKPLRDELVILRERGKSSSPILTNGWAHARRDPEILMAPALNWQALLMHKKNLLDHPERSELEQGEKGTVLNRSV